MESQRKKITEEREMEQKIDHNKKKTEEQKKKETAIEKKQL